jgi:hypothetical protein
MAAPAREVGVVPEDLVGQAVAVDVDELQERLGGRALQRHATAE